ncbi:MAG: flagellar export protein FliJ [Planctomycetota bacterium]|nr:MAG: flagellar export protein FliJ [Planctomycetota bacterium]
MKAKRRKIKQLNALLKVRKIEEDLKMTELAKKLSAHKAHEDQIIMIQNLKKQVYSNIKNDQMNNIDVSLMMKYQMYLREMHIKEIKSEQSLIETRFEVDQKRHELQKSNQNKVVVEKLIDKQKDALKTQIDKLETKQQDELSAQYFQRHDSGEVT